MCGSMNSVHSPTTGSHCRFGFDLLAFDDLPGARVSYFNRSGVESCMSGEIREPQSPIVPLVSLSLATWRGSKPLYFFRATRVERRVSKHVSKVRRYCFLKL